MGRRADRRAFDRTERQHGITSIFFYAFGLSLVIEGIALAAFGTDLYAAPALWKGRALRLPGFHIQRPGVLVLALAIVSGTALWAYLTFTVAGRAASACGESAVGSRIVAIRTSAFRRRVFIATAVLAALFGIIVSPITGFVYNSGPTISLVGVLAAGFAGFQGGAYTGLVLSVGVGYGVVVVGMVLQLGYSHQLAFSHARFMSLGGYGVALLETRYGFNSAESVLAVIGASAVVSLLIGSVLAGVPGLALPLATLVLPLGLSVLATYAGYLGSYEGITGIAPRWSGGDYASGAARSGVVAVLFLTAATAAEA